MANNPRTNMPVDLPIEVAPGIVHAERDIFSQPGPTRGFGVLHNTGVGIDGDKGNRGWGNLPPRRATDDNGMPWDWIR